MSLNSKSFFAVVPALLLACSAPAASTGTPNAGGSSSAAGSASGGSSNAAECSSGTLKVQAASNYTFSSEIKLTPRSVKPKSELTFDWSQLSSDFLGRPANPTTDIDSVLLVVFNLTLQQLEDTLNADDGTVGTKTAAVLQLLTNQAVTSKSLYDFGVPGTPEKTYRTEASVKASVDEYLDPAIRDPSTHIIAVMPSQGTQAGKNLRMIQTLQLDDTSSTTKVDIVGSTRITAAESGHSGGTQGPSASITYDVDLRHLAPIRVPQGQAGLSVDWSAMTDNGLGHPWLARSISRVFVGHYTQSLAELETQFFDLETIATDLYTLHVDNDDPVSLTGLKTAGGKAFSGVDDTGVWVLALSCSDFCSSPAPWYLTVLKPCD